MSFIVDIHPFPFSDGANEKIKKCMEVGKVERMPRPSDTIASNKNSLSMSVIVAMPVLCKYNFPQ